MQAAMGQLYPQPPPLGYTGPRPDLQSWLSPDGAAQAEPGSLDPQADGPSQG